MTTTITGATAWHIFPDDVGDDDAGDADTQRRRPSPSLSPAAVVDAARHRSASRPAAPTPVLLLLHANGFGAATYAPLARSLRAGLRGTRLARAPLLAPDFPGQGDSPRAAGVPAALGRPLTAPRLAAWLLSALGAQGLLGGGGGDDRPAARARGRAEIYCFAHSGGAATALAAEALLPGAFAAVFAYEPVEAPPAAREAQARALLFTSGSGGEALARMARKRRAEFASRAAARASLGAKPPFRGLCREALDLYLRTQLETAGEEREEGGGGCGGGREGGAASSGGGARTAGARTAAAAGAAAAATTQGTTTGAAASSPPASAAAACLKCAPEVEAEYFQAFSRPPHDWQPERVRCPVALACGGAAGGGLGGGGGGGGGGSGGGGGTSGIGGGGGGPHDALAIWAPLTARALPRGEMAPPFARLGHLGPLEGPGEVGAAAAAFFARVAEQQQEGGRGAEGVTGGGGAPRSKL